MKRLLSLGGLLAPLIFTIAVIVSGGMDPDYDHVNQFVSELGESGRPNAGLMNYLGFVATGVLIFGFTISLWLRFPRSRSSSAATLLLGAFSLGLITVGLFRCDPSCLPADPTTSHAIHDAVSGLMFISFILSTLLWSLTMRQHVEWKRFAVYSALTGAVSIALFVVLILSFDTRWATGLWQRLLLVTLYIWLARFSWRLSFSGSGVS